MYQRAAEEKPTLIKKRGMQKMRNSSRFSDGLIEKLDGCRDFSGGLGPGKNFEIHFDACQVLTQTVVQFAGEFAAFFILAFCSKREVR